MKAQVEDLVSALQAEFVYSAVHTVLGAVQRRVQGVVVAHNPPSLLDLQRDLLQVPHHAGVGVAGINIDKIEITAGQSAQQGRGVALVGLYNPLLDGRLKVNAVKGSEIDVEDVE